MNYAIMINQEKQKQNFNEVTTIQINPVNCLVIGCTSSVNEEGKGSQY